ncbi:MAG: DEAD/DEAH box helicase, partial [Bifidobacteriaceae bacterium]|nr:DEAD/DEAH box helicase [Bifidobacteriaceae bacterium]
MVSSAPAGPALPGSFAPATRAWFEGAFAAPTAAQVGAWDVIGRGHHALVVAPTGSGKTLAAFLSAIDRLLAEPPPEEAARRCRVLYVSPLKALAADVERNLRAPLAGITNAAVNLGIMVPDVRVGLRTGDTPARERRTFGTKPPDIFITTPESLYLVLTSGAREGLRGVDTVIIDEVHAIAGTKRGTHLALSLERLDALLDRPAQRVALSATVRPVEEVARFVAGARGAGDGGRPIEIVQPPAAKTLDIAVRLPVADLTDMGGPLAQPGGAGGGSGGSGGPPDLTGPQPDRTVPGEAAGAIIGEGHPTEPPPDLVGANPGGVPGVFGGGGVDWGDGTAGPRAELTGDAFGAERTGGTIWPYVHRAVLDQIEQHQSTLVFANSRRGAERLTARLNEAWQAERTGVAPDPGAANPSQYAGENAAAVDVEHVLAQAHHGSMSRTRRTQIEDALKAGLLPAVVATSSLELGIDMGAIDLVVQVGSPPSVASGLQRIGRAGHQVGAVSHGLVYPLFRGDLVPAAVTAQRMRDGAIEALAVPANPLDVLAQQIVAAVAMDEWTAADLYALVRRAAPYAHLGERTFEAVLDMLSGRYPSADFGDLKARLVWDRDTGELTPRPGAARLAIVSGGTIPDRGLYGVVLAGEEGKNPRRVGELDEEMVYESRVGDTFTLGSATWRIVDITPNSVLVQPAPGLPGRLPFWRGDSPGRPAELGAAIGRVVGAVGAHLDDPPGGGSDSGPERALGGLDEWARDNLLAYLRDQREATGVLPDERTIVVERYPDELGDWRVVIHTPVGARVTAPWGAVLAVRLRERYGLDAQVMPADDGIVLRLPETAEADAAGVVDPFIASADVRGLVTSAVTSSAHFAARFREAAARALLLPRRRPDRRQPLWQQRHRASQLLQIAAQYADFPIIHEAVRECLQDDYDVPALEALMA